MKTTLHTDPHQFFQAIHSFLKENEALNNLMLGTAFNMTKPDSPHASKERWMYSIEDQQGQTVYASLSVAPRNLIVAAKKEYIEQGNTMVIADLKKRKESPPGVIGEKTVSMDFAKKWCKNSETNYQIISEMGVFQLDKVADISYPKGNLRLAKTEEDLITEWLLEFDRELFGGQTPESARRIAKNKLKRQLLYFWEVEDEIVSMAAGTRPTDSCMTISSVYTPPQHRKKGYARSCVAQLSQTMLDKGYQLCALFTDLSNPTSNKIYKEIGYYQVGEFVNLSFT